MDTPSHNITFYFIILLFLSVVKISYQFHGVDDLHTRFRFYLLSAACMLFLPAGITQRFSQDVPEAETAPEPAAVLSGSYRILCHATGEIQDIPLRDYLIGAVAAEMPASYEPEALKAQTVACHTYAERIRKQNAAAPDPALCGADLSDDSSKYQAFLTADAMHELFGDAYDTGYAKIAAAVDAAGDLLLCYADEPIAAAFHAVSSGMTESAETVWGSALPYLVSVSSDADRNAPDYEETVRIPPDILKKALSAQNPECTFPDDPAAWFSAPECSPAGTVLQIQCGGTDWNGQLLRELLGLRSACFSVQYDGTQFLFTTQGYGHDVGMSQYGANAMAQDGCGFAEILAHYYPDTVLTPSSAG